MKKIKKNLIDNSKFKSGDIFLLSFEICGIFTSFKGICIALKKKSLHSLSSSCILRNIIDKVGIELTCNIYNKSNIKIKLYDYERKRFNYKSAKIYYLRNKSNQESLIKKYF